MSEIEELAIGIAARVGSSSRVVAAAESVTAGRIGQALVAAPDASKWFAGSVLAYRTDTKRRLLAVASETIVSPRCAREMAEGALSAMGADLVVATTGVGGPDSEEGQPAGTVFICAGREGQLKDYSHHFEGDPEEVVGLATLHALRHLHAAALELPS
jgi:PncC family amidohydrolase